jgi:hypothetical protein
MYYHLNSSHAAEVTTIADDAAEDVAAPPAVPSGSTSAGGVATTTTTTTTTKPAPHLQVVEVLGLEEFKSFNNFSVVGLANLRPVDEWRNLAVFKIIKFMRLPVKAIPTFIVKAHKEDRNSTWLISGYAIAEQIREYVITSWKSTHAFVLNASIALVPVRLPPYVLLEILDWLPPLCIDPKRHHGKKIALIQKVYQFAKARHDPQKLK